MIQNQLYRSLLLLLLLAATDLSFASKIAIIQYKVQNLNEVGVDADRLESFIREAAAQGAELIVAPETSFLYRGSRNPDGTRKKKRKRT